MTTVTVETHTATTPCESYVVAFANGRLNKETSSEMVFGCYQHKSSSDPRFSKRRIVVAETADMQYVAKNYGVPEVPTSVLSRHFVALVDRNSRTMKLCETKLLLAKPVASNVDNDDIDVPDAKSNEEALERGRAIEQSDRLTSTFGSRKKRRAMESRLKNTIKGEALDSAVNTAVQKALSKVQDTAATSPVSSASDLVPPHNKDATDVHKAYPLEGIITQDEIDVLSVAAEPLTKCDAEMIKQWQASNSYCSYILEHLRRLPVQASSRLHRASLLTYLHYLFTIHSWKTSDLKKKDPFAALEVPEVIQAKLLEAFTVQSGLGKNSNRSMPSRLKDKLAAYAIVLCFIIDEFSFEATHVQKVLALNSQKFTNYVRALGGVVVTKKSDNGDVIKVAQLRVPLIFPDGTRRRKGM